MRGLIVYNYDDYVKNAWFANKIQSIGQSHGMHMELLFAHTLHLCIENGKFTIYSNGKAVEGFQFVINRTRNAAIARHFEALGCRVFNSSKVTDICNNKASTHQYVNRAGVHSINTCICNKKTFDAENIPFAFPLIVKSASGHGGKEVYKVENVHSLQKIVPTLPEESFVLQEFSHNCGVDIRVYIIDGEIIAAVKRCSLKDFKSNISLGGEAEKYILSESETYIITAVCQCMKFDFVGIDFILGHNNEFLFNEIEDVVGCRALYELYSFDILEIFINNIQKNVM